jgi:hypothetical protein
VKDPGAPKFQDLKHRLALCTQRDVVAGPSTMELRRTEVVWCWGRVRSHYGLPMFLGGQNNYTVMDLTTKATHAITVRSGLALIITDTAYVYEEFRKSPPRWYKVLGFSEIANWTTMTTRLVEQSDMAIPPQPSVLAPQPYKGEL